MYQAIKRYNVLNSADDRLRLGHPHTTWTVEAVKAVREHIQLNPLSKQIIMRELDI